MATIIHDGAPPTQLTYVLLDYVKNKRGLSLLEIPVYNGIVATYNTLQELIKSVSTSDTINWSAFEKFTGQVTPLENLIFKTFFANPLPDVPTSDPISGTSNNPDILKLSKLVTTIRRPLYGRSSAIVKLLYFLDVTITDDTIRGNFNLVVADAIVALQNAKETATDVRTIKLTDAAYLQRASEIQAIFGRIEDLFTAIAVANKLPGIIATFQIAVDICERQLTLMISLLGIN